MPLKFKTPEELEDYIFKMQEHIEILEAKLTEVDRQREGGFKAVTDAIDQINSKLSGKKPAPEQIPPGSRLRGAAKRARFNTNETTRAEIASLYEEGPDGKTRLKKTKSAAK